MIETIHSRSVLVLNKQWQAISIVSAAHAFSQIVSGTADALYIEGFNVMEPMAWDRWKDLPLVEGVESTGTPSGRVRTPKVIVLRSFSQMPMYKPKLSLHNLYIRDKGVCQYSGKRLPRSHASIDHVVPQSKGGPTTWENCVLAERKLNSVKGDKSVEEAGLKLLSQPSEPQPIPVIMTLTNPNKIPEWDYFLLKEVA